MCFNPLNQLESLNFSLNMTTVTASQLAARLNKTRGRISQMVKEGVLAGCYTGEGRARRFDLEKSMVALGRNLDPGQMMGNGAGTKQVIQEMAAPAPDGGAELPLPAAKHPAGASKLNDGDRDAYSMARTTKAIEEARKLQRQNAEAAGQYVLASEAELQIKRLMSQEIAEFEQVLRTAARAIADEFGVDFKITKSLLINQWRTHREKRARLLANAANEAGLSDAEKEQDI